MGLKAHMLAASQLDQQMEIDVSSGECKLKAPPGEDDSCLKIDDTTAQSEDVDMEDVWKKPSEDTKPECL